MSAEYPGKDETSGPIKSFFEAYIQTSPEIPLYVQFDQFVSSGGRFSLLDFQRVCSSKALALQQEPTEMTPDIQAHLDILDRAGVGDLLALQQEAQSLAKPWQFAISHGTSDQYTRLVAGNWQLVLDDIEEQIKMQQQEKN